MADFEIGDILVLKDRDLLFRCARESQIGPEPYEVLRLWEKMPHWSIHDPELVVDIRAKNGDEYYGIKPDGFILKERIKPNWAKEGF